MISSSQPVLFETMQAGSGMVELFPAVWGACEQLIAGNTMARQEALDRLLELDAPRLSPLVAYLVATRLDEPDLLLRGSILELLGGLLSGSVGRQAIDPVRQVILAYLGHMPFHTLWGLLDVVSRRPELALSLSYLLNVCPYVGSYLLEIISDRKQQIAIRKQAAYLIGQVGYLDALPALERLAVRLEARLSGQQAMSFAPPGQADEIELFPIVHQALRLLRAP